MIQVHRPEHLIMRRPLLAGLALALLTAPAAAQAPKNALELRYYGHSFFQLTTTTGVKIVFDPHAISDYGAPPLSPDIVVMSHSHNDHNRKEVLANADSKDLKAFLGVIPKGKSGEWAKIDETVKGVRVRSVPSWHDEEEGMKRGRNAIF